MPQTRIAVTQTNDAIGVHVDYYAINLDSIDGYKRTLAEIVRTLEIALASRQRETLKIEISKS